MWFFTNWGNEEKKRHSLWLIFSLATDGAGEVLLTVSISLSLKFEINVLQYKED